MVQSKQSLGDRMHHVIAFCSYPHHPAPRLFQIKPRISELPMGTPAWLGHKSFDLAIQSSPHSAMISKAQNCDMQWLLCWSYPKQCHWNKWCAIYVQQHIPRHICSPCFGATVSCLQMLKAIPQQPGAKRLHTNFIRRWQPNIATQ